MKFISNPFSVICCMSLLWHGNYTSAGTHLSSESERQLLQHCGYWPWWGHEGNYHFSFDLFSVLSLLSSSLFLRYSLELHNLHCAFITRPLELVISFFNQMWAACAIYGLNTFVLHHLVAGAPWVISLWRYRYDCYTWVTCSTSSSKLRWPLVCSETNFHTYFSLCTLTSPQMSQTLYWCRFLFSKRTLSNNALWISYKLKQIGDNSNQLSFKKMCIKV